jgi:hypothetical protein
VGGREETTLRSKEDGSTYMYYIYTHEDILMPTKHCLKKEGEGREGMTR